MLALARLELLTRQVPLSAEGDDPALPTDDIAPGEVVLAIKRLIHPVDYAANPDLHQESLTDTLHLLARRRGLTPAEPAVFVIKTPAERSSMMMASLWTAHQWDANYVLLRATLRCTNPEAEGLPASRSS